MKHAFVVTIATDLSSQEICDTKSFRHKSILDLRCSDCGSSRAAPESLFKRLRNFQISYDQRPTNLLKKSSDCENPLVDWISDQNSDVMIITDHVVAVARICQKNGISFSSRELYIVETGSDHVPVQLGGQVQYDERVNSLAG